MLANHSIKFSVNNRREKEKIIKIIPRIFLYKYSFFIPAFKNLNVLLKERFMIIMASSTKTVDVRSGGASSWFSGYFLGA